MNLVLTISIGDIYEKISKYTHPTIKKYADKIGADFISIDSCSHSSPHWEKFQIYHLLNRYKRILFLDSDLIIRDDCPNLFKIVPENKLGLFNEAPFTENRFSSLEQACRDYDIKLSSWNGKYYNTGVLVCSRIHKHLFQKPSLETFNFYEQGYLNAIFAKFILSTALPLKIFDLPYPLNRMCCMDRFTGEERFASYIIHYAGFPSLQFVLSLIPADLERWEKNKPGYKYKRHILIDVQGGLGDQVDAEPSIRFLKKHVYPDDEVVVKTHFPRLFKHIQDIDVVLHEDFISKPDTPYYHALSLPGPEKLQWSIISNLLCHTVDYVSMALMRRILPINDKQIKLTVDLEDISKVIEVVGIQNLNELVLIHPGRHWQSKTIPVEWWNKVIAGLSFEKIPLALIGFEDETRGTLPVSIPPGVIDTRNLLDLSGLIALISAASILISNDSAPIHIAGAFNNWIILIPTCKHPDHLLPYRNGSQNYKSISLYDKLVIDDICSQPTCIHGSSGEFIKGKWSEYLPDPKLVVEKIYKIYSSCLYELKEDEKNKKKE